MVNRAVDAVHRYWTSVTFIPFTENINQNNEGSLLFPAIKIETSIKLVCSLEESKVYNAL